MLGSQEEPGIMVHTLNSLFKKMDQTKEETEYQVSMGYLEVGRRPALLSNPAPPHPFPKAEKAILLYLSMAPAKSTSFTWLP